MVFAEIGKFVGSKVAAAVIFLAVAAGGVWCYQHPEAVNAFGRVVKYTLIWLVVTAALPWSSYLFMRPMLAMQSRMTNAQTASLVSLALIAAYTLINIVHALWLAGGGIHGGFTWLVVLLGFAAAGAYNFVICESLARHVDG